MRALLGELTVEGYLLRVEQDPDPVLAVVHIGIGPVPLGERPGLPQASVAIVHDDRDAPQNHVVLTVEDGEAQPMVPAEVLRPAAPLEGVHDDSLVSERVPDDCLADLAILIVSSNDGVPRGGKESDDLR